MTEQELFLCHAMACFEWNLHTQISGGDSVLSTTFCTDHIWTLRFCSTTHYDITIGNDVARDVHCDIIMGYDVAMRTYHDVTMHTDVTMTLIYVLLCPIMNIILHILEAFGLMKYHYTKQFTWISRQGYTTHSFLL